jgi:hypothetical protein
MIIHSFAKEGISDLGRRKSYVEPTYNGRTWSSSSQSIVAYGRRKKMLRLELQKRFELIPATEDLDPKQFHGLETPKSLR